MGETASLDFFREYATAMLVWQHVETALFTFFHSLMGGTELKRVGAVFYSQDAFGAKLRTVDATAKVVLTGDELAAWTKLHARMLKAYGRRNVLAHFSAVANNVNTPELELVLAPPVFVPNELVRNRNKIDTDECSRLMGQFEELAMDINAFTAQRRS